MHVPDGCTVIHTCCACTHTIDASNWCSWETSLMDGVCACSHIMGDTCVLPFCSHLWSFQPTHTNSTLNCHQPQCELGWKHISIIRLIKENKCKVRETSRPISQGLGLRIVEWDYFLLAHNPCRILLLLTPWLPSTAGGSTGCATWDTMQGIPQQKIPPVTRII